MRLRPAPFALSSAFVVAAASAPGFDFVLRTPTTTNNAVVVVASAFVVPRSVPLRRRPPPRSSSSSPPSPLPPLSAEKKDDDDGSGSDADAGRPLDPGDPDAWDDPSDYSDFDPNADPADAPSPYDSDVDWGQPKLGIDIGAQLQPLSASDAESLRAEAAAEIEKAFEGRLDEVDDLRKQVQKDFEDSRKKLALASDLRAQREGEKLLGKIDAITDKFLEETRTSREGTKLAAEADNLTGKKGQGLEVGSWGLDRYGRVVVAEGKSASGRGVLGGVSARFADAEREAKSAAKALEEGSEVAKTKVATENKIIVVSDDRQDPGAKKILDRFSALLAESFADSSDAPVTVERVPSSSPVPLGGLNARTAIVVASCVGDRSNAVSLLDRLLKRTAVAGGTGFGVPPTHIVVLSSLGTERTDKFPYNTQNLLGGKLSKRRDVEEAVVGTVKGRMPGVQVPLDYTIFKVGDVVDDDKVSSKGEFELMPGDVLDGPVGVEAAATALVRAVAFQPSARNATLSVAGTTSTMTAIDEEDFWDDAFLRLDGPELLRIDGLADKIGVSPDIDGGSELDKRYDLLSEYLREWSAQTFEGGAKGTGLTTPVVVRPSHRDPSAAEGAQMRSGVRILFMQTNTGTRYKSKDEERALEKERRNPSPSPPASDSDKNKANTLKKRKASKEGGVEVLAERTTKGDLRVRARRCNMDDDTVVKEMSEGAILKQLEKGIEVWIKEQNE